MDSFRDLPLWAIGAASTMVVGIEWNRIELFTALCITLHGYIKVIMAINKQNT